MIIKYISSNQMNKSLREYMVHELRYVVSPRGEIHGNQHIQ